MEMTLTELRQRVERARDFATAEAERRTGTRAILLSRADAFEQVLEMIDEVQE